MLKKGEPSLFKGRKHTEESKKKISEHSNHYAHWAGKKRPEETRRKMSVSRKGIGNSFYGKKHSEEAKRKMRFKKLGLSGEKAGNWQGGLKGISYGVDWTVTFKRSIRERDRYTCQICSKQQGNMPLHCHHVDYNKKNNDPNNIITLCRRCHLKTNGNRDYWTKYFKELKHG